MDTRPKGRDNSVINDVIAEINYTCNYMQVFLRYTYNVKAYLNVSTLQLKHNINWDQRCYQKQRKLTVLQEMRWTVPLNFPNAALSEDKTMILEETQCVYMSRTRK